VFCSRTSTVGPGSTGTDGPQGFASWIDRGAKSGQRWTGSESGSKMSKRAGGQSSRFPGSLEMGRFWRGESPRLEFIVRGSPRAPCTISESWFPRDALRHAGSSGRPKRPSHAARFADTSGIWRSTFLGRGGNQGSGGGSTRIITASRMEMSSRVGYNRLLVQARKGHRPVEAQPVWPGLRRVRGTAIQGTTVDSKGRGSNVDVGGTPPPGSEGPTSFRNFDKTTRLLESSDGCIQSLSFPTPPPPPPPPPHSVGVVC